MKIPVCISLFLILAFAGTISAQDMYFTFDKPDWATHYFVRPTFDSLPCERTSGISLEWNTDSVFAWTERCLLESLTTDEIDEFKSIEKCYAQLYLDSDLKISYASFLVDSVTRFNFDQHLFFSVYKALKGCAYRPKNENWKQLDKNTLNCLTLGIPLISKKYRFQN